MTASLMVEIFDGPALAGAEGVASLMFEMQPKNYQQILGIKVGFESANITVVIKLYHSRGTCQFLMTSVFL